MQSRVIENPGAGLDTIYSTTHFRLPANVETLVLQGSADLQAYGNAFAIYGLAAAHAATGDAEALALAQRTFRWLEAGHSTSTIGIFWSIGVGVEIVAFVFGGRITARLTSRKIIVVACIAGILRWGIFGLSAELAPTLVVQILQGATLGLTQIGVASYIRQNIAPAFLSSATGVYWASTGLITALAILISARLYPISSSYVFLFTAILCAVGTVVAALMMEKSNRGNDGVASLP